MDVIFAFPFNYFGERRETVSHRLNFNERILMNMRRGLTFWKSQNISTFELGRAV